MRDFEEIEQRLREHISHQEWPTLQDRAAASIRQLRQERDEATDYVNDADARAVEQAAVIAELKEALRPFAAGWAHPDDVHGCRQIERARAALSRLEKGEAE